MLRPLWGNVLVTLVTQDQRTKNGVYVPDTAKVPEEIFIGTVEAMGSGSLALDGSPIPMEPGVVEGAVIYFLKHEARKVPGKSNQFFVDHRYIVAVE